MSQPHPSETETLKPITNVDLQFMGEKNLEERLNKRVEVQNKAPGEFVDHGLDKADVESAQSMITSDPPSSNMGELQPETDESSYGD